MRVNPKHRSDLFWSAIETGGSAAIAVATTVATARFLGPADFGLIMSAFAFIQIGAFFTENAFNDALLRRSALGEEHVHSAYLASIALGAAFTVGFAACAGPIATLLESPPLAPAVVVMSLTLLCNGLSSVPMSLLRRDLRFRDIALRTLYARATGAATAIAGLVAGIGIWAVVWQQVVAAVVSAACLAPFARPALRGRFSAAALRELAPMSLFTNTTSMLGIAAHRVYLAAISLFLGPTALGLFTIANRIVDTLRAMIQHAAVQLIFRRLAARQDDPAAMRALYLTATRLGGCLAVPVFAGLYVTAPQLVEILLQPRWAPAIDVIRLLAVAAALLSLRMFDGALNNALGRPQVSLAVASFTIAAGFALLYGFMAAGSVAVEQAWLARAAVGYACSTLAVRWNAGVSLREQVRAQFPVLSSTVVMVVVLLVVERQLPAEMAAAPTLAVIVPVGVVVYGATLWLLARGTFARLRQLALGS